MKSLRAFHFKLMLFLAITGFHGAFAQGADIGTQAAPATDQSKIAIGPGDLLDLTVFNVPELILKVRVDSNGVVNLPLIGDLKLGGMTARDAQVLIARELVDRQMVNNPEVSLLIEVFATQGITVSGEVNAPGIYSLVGPHRLYDAISAAGGITAKAGPTVTIVHAGQPDLPEIVTLPGRTFDLHTNVMIFPGDTVIVSKAGIVYVVGEVSRPGGFLMENNTTMSLLNAIALAQGTTKFASLKHVFLIRKSPEGSLQIELSLDKIYHGESSDIRLKADDVLFVPTSNWKTYGPLGIQGAIQAAVYSAYAIELRP